MGETYIGEIYLLICMLISCGVGLIVSLIGWIIERFRK